MLNIPTTTTTTTTTTIVCVLFLLLVSSIIILTFKVLTLRKQLHESQAENKEVSRSLAVERFRRRRMISESDQRRQKKKSQEVQRNESMHEIRLYKKKENIVDTSSKKEKPVNNFRVRKRIPRARSNSIVKGLTSLALSHVSAKNMALSPQTEKKKLERDVDFFRDLIKEETMGKIDEETEKWIDFELKKSFNKKYQRAFKKVLSTIRISNLQEKKRKRGMIKRTTSKFFGGKELVFDAKFIVPQLFYRNFSTQLHDLDTIDFDVLKIDKKEHPLVKIAVSIFDKFHFFRKFRIKVSKFEDFIKAIEVGYSKYNNPYHNIHHACDVLQMAYVFVCLSDKLKHNLNDVHKLCLFLACIGHDYYHPGTSNRFQVEMETKKAIDYNYQSVLENLSTTLFLKDLKKYKILNGNEKEEIKEMRRNIVTLILSTDTRSQYDLLGKLNNINKQENKKIDTKDLLMLLMKCADVSNCSRNKELMLKWTSMIMKEFFNQGEKEKSLEFQEISPFMDASTTSIPKCQVGFLSFLCMPLFKCLSEYDECFNFIENRINKRIQIWKELVNIEHKNGVNIKLDELNLTDIKKLGVDFE